ncbi:hypothetical protein DFJ73DRAFT_756022 [Zopfochytrium polystomum]|nr:hypothetical protein DFJ73DRAFT_756022 [Zopfochytrium polystomum]
MSAEGLDAIVNVQQRPAIVAAQLYAWCERALAAADRQNAFYFFFPTLCSFLFGADAVSIGVFRRQLDDRDASALCALLSPQSPFFRLVLRLSMDPSMLYEIALDKLPAPTQRQLRSFPERTKLSSIYTGKLQVDYARQIGPGGAAGGGVGAVNAGMSPAGQTNPMDLSPERRRASLKPNTAPEVKMEARPTMGSMNRLPSLGFHASYFNRSVAGLDQSFYEILNQYLHFFIPVTSGAAKADDPLKSTLKTQSPSSRRAVMSNAQGALFSSVEQTGAFKSRSGKQQQYSPLRAPKINPSYNILSDIESVSGGAVGISQFVVGVLVELWLNQNEATDVSKSGEASKPAFLSPPPALLECVKRLVSHTSKLRLYEVNIEALPNQTDQMKIAINTYHLVQQSLFYFLRSGLRFASAEGGFSSIVDIWVLYAFPWSNDPARKPTDGRGLSEDHILFIAQNFLFYSRLFQIFVERAVTFDIFAAVRPVDLTSSGGSGGTLKASQPAPKASLAQSPVHANIGSLEKVLASLVKTEGLLSVLRLFDDLVCSNQDGFYAALRFEGGGGGGSMMMMGGGGGGTNSMPSTPSRGSVGRQRMPSGGLANAPAWLNRFGPENLAAILRSTVIGYEGKMDYRAVFKGQANDPGKVLAKSLIGNIINTINRLKTYLPVDQPKPPSEGPRKPRIRPPPPSSSSPTSPWDASAVFATVWFVLTTLLAAVESAYDECFGNRKASAAAGAGSSGGGPGGARGDPRSQPVQSSIARLEGLVASVAKTFSVDQDELAAIASECSDGLDLLGPTAAAGGAAAGFGSGGELGFGGGGGGGLFARDFYGGEDGDAVLDESKVFRREWAPGVLTPDLHDENRARLTSYGRLQVKRGLRMCSATDIPVIPTERSANMVMSYEIAWIVRLTAWVAAAFDAKYADLRQRYPRLPARVGLHWLRLLAAKQNLAFFCVFFACVYLFYSTLVFLFFSSSSSASGAAAGAARGPPPQHAPRMPPGMVGQAVRQHVRARGK